MQKVINNLFALIDRLSDELKHYLRDGLDNDAPLAVVALLQRDSLTKCDRPKINKLAEDLLDTPDRGIPQIDHSHSERRGLSFDWG